MRTKYQSPLINKTSRYSSPMKKPDEARAVRSKIVKALNNKKFVARTVSGISKETELPTHTVTRALRTDSVLRAVVKIMPVKSKDGRALLTTRERFHKEAGLKTKFIDFFASKRVEIEDGEF